MVYVVIVISNVIYVMLLSFNTRARSLVLFLQTIEIQWHYINEVYISS